MSLLLCLRLRLLCLCHLHLHLHLHLVLGLRLCLCMSLRLCHWSLSVHPVVSSGVQLIEQWVRMQAEGVSQLRVLSKNASVGCNRGCWKSLQWKGLL